MFAAAQSSTPLNIWDLVGITIALIGVATEGLADHQLSRFKANPTNQGRVMDTGLWGYSRHPNYFGNAVLWVGLGVVGLASAGPLWALAGPAVMIFLFFKGYWCADGPGSLRRHFNLRSSYGLRGAWLELGSVNESARAVCKHGARCARGLCTPNWGRYRVVRAAINK